MSREKQKRLAYVARRYYLEGQRQSDIARELNISRPMVSRLLSEARESGVVEIRIHDPETRMASLLERLRFSSSIRGGVLVEDGGDNDATNERLSQGAVELLQQLGTRRLGELYRRYPVEVAICGHVHYRKTLEKDGITWMCRCLNYHSEWRPEYGGDTLSQQIAHAAEVMEL